ncbi:hypothetical protein [Paenarthrobacter ureafaciens]|uniref:hypothetical protein n=1 Tax=Paenarthrobacter ureafaciens TaxID=37931 RepID=UPI001FB1EA6D|nr:hypothetical protein [Paenarthrobacter ureafaciens]UOD83511.1 hypothetical protein MQZ73_20695 [Paenarthrobacter ureafaciens]
MVTPYSSPSAPINTVEFAELLVDCPVRDLDHDHPGGLSAPACSLWLIVVHDMDVPVLVSARRRIGDTPILRHV